MKNKVIIFGCSFSQDLDTKWLSDDEMSKWELDVRAFGGNSNPYIIKQVYDYVNSDSYKPTDIINIQYSYTNRFWTPSNLNGSHNSFHGLWDGEIFVSNPNIKDKLRKFIELFTVLFYDNKKYLEYHLMQIELLKIYLDSKKVKYIHYIHSKHSHYDEVFRNGYHVEQIKSLGKKINTPIDKKYNFLNFEDYDNMSEWSIHKNITNSKTDLHLNDKGNQEYINYLLTHWKLLV